MRWPCHCLRQQDLQSSGPKPGETPETAKGLDITHFETSQKVTDESSLLRQNPHRLPGGQRCFKYIREGSPTGKGEPVLGARPLLQPPRRAIPSDSNNNYLDSLSLRQRCVLVESLSSWS